MQMRRLLISIMLMVCSPATAALAQSDEPQTDEQSDQEQEQEQRPSGTGEVKQARLFTSSDHQQAGLTFLGSPMQPGSFANLLKSALADYKELDDELADEAIGKQAASGVEVDGKSSDLDAQMAEVLMRIDKRSKQPTHATRLSSPGKAFKRRQEMMNLLLQELPQLEIETLGSRLKVNAQGRSVLTIAPVLGPSSGGGSGGGGGGGNGSGLPKRTSSRHLPCYFNAISCF